MVKLTYKGWGIVIEPRFNAWVPFWYIFLGGKYSISYNYFHNGIGFHFLLPGVNVMLCTKGKIGWWMDPGKIRVNLFGKELINNNCDRLWTWQTGSFTIIVQDGKEIAIKCKRCGLTSYNLNDVVNRYCGMCHQFHEPVNSN